MKSPMVYLDAMGKIPAPRSEQQPIQVLQILSVEDSERCASLITKNIEKLEEFGNEFNFAILHFDGSNEHWKNLSWYNDSSRVVFRCLKPGTKTFQWKKIKPELVEQYDYVWFSDCDIGLEKFNWPVYRKILNRSQYLISQPSVMPSRPGGRSTDKHWLRFRKGVGLTKIVRTGHRKRSESQTPIISSKCWSLIYEKLLQMNNRSIWGIQSFWEKLVKNKILLVHGSPVVHHDTRTLSVNGGERKLIRIRRIRNESLRIKKFVETNYKEYIGE